jgi:hypothetical protein
VDRGTPNWVKIKTAHGRHIDEERRSPAGSSVFATSIFAAARISLFSYVPNNSSGLDLERARDGSSHRHVR